MNAGYFQKLSDIPLIGVNPTQSEILEKIYKCGYYSRNSTRIYTKILECPKCKKDLSYSNLLRYHLRNCEEKEKNATKNSWFSRMFATRQNKISDLKECDDMICHICFKSFDRKEKYEEHVSKHLGMRCDVCFKEFDNHDDIFHHKRFYCRSFIRR